KNTAAGHIIHMSLQNGAFKVNGTAADAEFIGEWMHVDADVDFGSKAVNVKLTNDSGKESEYETTIFSTSYEDNLGSFYMRSGGANGTLSFDNLRIKITGSASLPVAKVESDINYKSFYAFGDSIVYGHNTPQESFMQLISNDYAVNLNMMAKNGATIIKSDNHILTQIKNAPNKAPDFVVFDGYTNDAYEGINYGTPKGASATAFDNTSFCGGFEEILYTMKQKWPESKIVFVTIHKSGARDFEIQTQLHDLTVEMCGEWGVSVVDMFKDSVLDTRNADEMAKYIIGGSGSHPNKLCCETYYIPAVTAKLEALVNSEDEPGEPTETEKPANPQEPDSNYNYVSATEGRKIVGYETSLHIQYGTKEDKSVVRAIGDLVDDIKAVTGKQSTMRADDDILLGGLPPHGIIYDLFGPMCVVTYDFVPADSTCYVAAYNADGSLNTVAQATKANYTDENGDTTIFEFDEAVERPAYGSMKAFVWDNNMKPATNEVLDIESEGSILVIGTLGTDSLVDKYAETNENIAALEGKRESFTIQNINGSVVIAGSDKRGTIYGIYDFCEKMGVSPWEFWADVEPEKKENLYINLPESGYTEGEPSVEYRGIFLNDEFNLNQWTNSEFAANMNSKKYEKIYELILRLKMNTLWPAMHQYSTAFHNVPDAAEKADEYGVVIGSSHAEPLLRNNLGELDVYQAAWINANPDKPLNRKIENETGTKVAYYWSSYESYDSDGNGVGTYYYNKEFLTDYWRDSVKASGQYDNIYTLGMRGVHDGSFQTNMNYEEALKEIIAAQIQILKDELVGEGKKYSRIEDVPMVFIPYK
ncbi:MAG: glycosyl hydrolase 115 family protein, partial [Clostridia bacterium]|nr:glycosyl hydrolase 115 family protein [Clostridia bacterium]